MVRKIMKREAIRCFLQRVHAGNTTDTQFEVLSRFPKVEGYQTLKYGHLDVQYYRTLTNTAKSTLYVICADRTMRIERSNGVMPGSRPVIVELAEQVSIQGTLYTVTFDSGDVGVFSIDFRPQKENEQAYVPHEVWRLPGTHGTAGAPAPAATPAADEVSETQEADDTDGRGRAGVVAERGADADWPAPTTEAGGTAAPTGVEPDGRPRVVADAEYRTLEVDGQPIDFGRKRKRRDFVRFLHERRLKTGEDIFMYTEMAETFGKSTGRVIDSERFEEDLFKGQSPEFHLLFEVLDKKKGKYRIRI